MEKRKKVSAFDRISMIPIVREVEGLGHSGKDEVEEVITLLGGMKAKVTRRARYSKRYNEKVRIFMHITDESLAENLVNRRNRPVMEWRKIVQQVLWHYKMDTKFTFSQYAGCSCPCSPGFILDAYCHGTIWIEVHKSPELLNDGNKEDLNWYAGQFGLDTPTFEDAIKNDEVLV